MRLFPAIGIVLLLVGLGSCSGSGGGGGAPPGSGSGSGSSVPSAQPSGSAQACSPAAFAQPSGTILLVPTTLKLEAISTALSFPLFMTAPPCDVSRLFVVEKGGNVRIIKNGVLLSRPFLNVVGLISNGGEQGLLGLAFDPNYAKNGRFYINYTDSSGTTVIARYLVDPTDPDVALQTVDKVLLRILQPFANHNGGMLVFGPDGYLYIGMGDGGAGGDPDNRAQNLNDLLGKLLRIDVALSTPPNDYAIPPDNPFLGQAGARPEIWSLGLRNPWRFSFDRLTGHDLYLGDVGQNEREEINVSPGGTSRRANYGWRLMEGLLCFNPSTNCNPGNTLTLPVLDYNHSDGCAVTGGYVYRGAAIPALRGTYFYADLCQGWVRSFRWQNGQLTEQTDWLLLRPGNITSFGEDAAGELYLMTSQGGLFRIVAN